MRFDGRTPIRFARQLIHPTVCLGAETYRVLVFCAPKNQLALVLDLQNSYNLILFPCPLTGF